MKKLTFIISLALTILKSYGQHNEFKVYNNGLIYSEEAMTKLGYVVDSLNLKFKTCDFDKVFHSRQQVLGHIIRIDTGDIKSAKKDLEQNISFEAFCLKYPAAKIDKNVLLLKQKYTNYRDTEIVEIEHFDLTSDYGGFAVESKDLSLYNKDFTNTWLFDYRKKSKYSNESLTSFYFPNNFKQFELPNKYSLMIGYSDCLIDTNTTKLKADLKEDFVPLPENWSTLSLKKKKKLLDKLRSTRVVGFCSQDSRPRTHAVNIALLSAETFNWQIFLKSHLDIMNDRFERMSDGNYAWEERHTYIKELESLDINVIDLIFGICLRIEDPAKNHYYGSVGRVGRALSESKNKDVVLNNILSAIADSELDLYNRLVFYFLFKNYNYHISDESEKKINTEKLNDVLSSFPENFRVKLTQ